MSEDEMIILGLWGLIAIPAAEQLARQLAVAVPDHPPVRFAFSLNANNHLGAVTIDTRIESETPSTHTHTQP